MKNQPDGIRCLKGWFCVIKDDLADLPFAGLQTEDSAVSFQGSVSIVGKNTGRKDFAQLNAFLIETVDIPDKALEHYFVLEVGKKGTQSLRI
jgi:hypothetical protein